MSNEISDENAFLITKLDSEEKSNILFINSSILILNRLGKIFRYGQKDELTIDLLKRVKNCLTNLIFFVINGDEESNVFETDGNKNFSFSYALIIIFNFLLIKIKFYH